jgi:acetyltransferase-like isoleucine patch superfamily enzyme
MAENNSDNKKIYRNHGGTVSKVLWLVRKRPAHLFRAARGYLLFKLTYLTRLLLKDPSLGLADNVRLQKNSSLMAEKPNARITVGENSIIYEDCKIEAYGSALVSIGKDSILGGVKIASRHRVTIGERFLCSWNVFIQDYDSHPTSQSKRALQVMSMVENFKPSFQGKNNPRNISFDWDFPGSEIIIGHDVWIGSGATLLKGAKIGSGSIIASGAVVLKGDYPERSLIAGNPARIIKNLEDDQNHVKKALLPVNLNSFNGGMNDAPKMETGR